MKIILKYLKEEWYKYVLEIVVVTLGIWIAFGLNNWKETQDQKNIEQRFIYDLKEDLTLDSLQLAELLHQSLETSKSKVRLMEYFDGKVNNLDSVIYHYKAQWDIGREFIPNSNTIEAVKASAGLSILKSNVVRREIIGLYASYKQYEKTEAYFLSKYVDFQEYVFPLFRDVGEPTISEIANLQNYPAIVNRIRYNYAVSRYSSLMLIAQKNAHLLSMLREYRG